MAFTTCDCPVSTTCFLDFPDDVVPLPMSPKATSSIFVPLQPNTQMPLPPRETDQKSVSPYVQKKKRAPRKPRVSKRKLATTPEDDGRKVVQTPDGEGFMFVDDPVSVKGGKPAPKKKRSKDTVCENAVAEKEATAKRFAQILKDGAMGMQHREDRFKRLSQRFVFCRRNQLQWHIQRVVTQIVNDMCLGCKKNCDTDHSICYRSPAYIMTTYPETCARMLLEKGEDGVCACDKQFIDHIAMYDPEKESAVRLPSSILVSYFWGMYPDVPWADKVLTPHLSFAPSQYAFAPPRYDQCNPAEVMSEALFGVLMFSPAYSFFFK